MASFVAHGLVGAVATAIPYVYIFPKSRSKVVFWALAQYGFVVGSCADTWDALLAWMGLIPRWSLYHWFHHDMPSWLYVIFYQIWLHVGVVDPPFHVAPNWWPRMWQYEVLLWVVPIALLGIYSTSFDEEKQ
jgi:hypothetical protein